MRLLRGNGAASLSRLRHSVGDGLLPMRGVGLGAYLEDAMTLCTATSMAIAFFGIRRAPEVAKTPKDDVRVGAEAGVAGLKV